MAKETKKNKGAGQLPLSSMYQRVVRNKTEIQSRGLASSSCFAD